MNSEQRSMTMRFHAKFSNRNALFAIAILTLGCTDSPELVSVSTKKADRRINHLVPIETYEQARSEASNSRQQKIVESCRQLEGKRKTPAVTPEAIQTMQEVLFESETPEVRAVVAAGLGNAGSVASVPKLLDAMEDDALVTRQAAAKSVAKLMGWREGFNPEDTPEKRAQAVEHFRERWLLFEQSELYQVATDPEARKRATAVAQKRAKFDRRKERGPENSNNSLPKDSPQPNKLLSPQHRPSTEELKRQLRLNE